MTFFPIRLIAQSKNKIEVSKSDSSKSYSSTFEIQRMKFQRMLREKYAFADSVSYLWSFSPEQRLKFKIHGGKFLDFDTKFPIYPELYRNSWENELRKRASGGSEQILFNPIQIANAFQSKQEWERSKHEFKNKFIPSNLQLNVLRVLWEEPSATQIDIYLGIDKEYPITAQRLDKQLERMVNLGLVERKMISPQHTFTILTPLKAFQIEMSAKNRKNRVYLYRFLVEKKNIVQFLLARYSKVKNEGAGNPKELKRLSKKLEIVLADEEG